MSAHADLTGKVVVVTGGTGILGHAFIKGIVEAGGAVEKMKLRAAVSR